MARSLKPNIEHKRERTLASMTAHLDRVVIEAERCGRKTNIRKQLLMKAESIRERIFLMEAERDQRDIAGFIVDDRFARMFKQPISLR